MVISNFTVISHIEFDLFEMALLHSGSNTHTHKIVVTILSMNSADTFNLLNIGFCSYFIYIFYIDLKTYFISFSVCNGIKSYFDVTIHMDYVYYAF